MASRDRDRLDEWLEGALRQHETAEPRPGLEGRVLARIAAESKRHRTPRSWAWILATASATVFALICIRVGYHAGKAPNSGVAEVAKNSIAPQVAEASASVPLEPIVRNRSHRKRTPALAKSIGEPKLEHFPSRRPLSEQELVLVGYAERFPAEAALIAQEQGKFDEEIAKAQEEVEKGSSRSNQ